MTTKPRVYLSSPHMGGLEFGFVKEAFDSNWIAPLGPHVDAFERELAAKIGIGHAAATSSGTAAIHLALILSGVSSGDEVVCSSLTFSASANPIVYCNAKPVFIDAEPESWNMDPNLLEDFLKRRHATGRLPKALILVHLYGQSANLEAIADLCERYGVILIEDAAEALGTTCIYKGKTIAPGTIGKFGIFSFNGNKVITTSGGGMLVSADEMLIKQSRFLATQARDPAPHYEHSHIGYNYRMSNICAAIGRGQLQVLDDRVKARRANFEFYTRALGDLSGLVLQPEVYWGKHSRWLTCITIDPRKSGGVDREKVRLALEADNIESRPIWKPMHLQPVFKGCEYIGGSIGEKLFNDGLCLPSGSNLSENDLQRTITIIRKAFSV